MVNIQSSRFVTKLTNILSIFFPQSPYVPPFVEYSITKVDPMGTFEVFRIRNKPECFQMGSNSVGSCWYIGHA